MQQRIIRGGTEQDPPSLLYARMRAVAVRAVWDIAMMWAMSRLGRASQISAWTLCFAWMIMRRPELGRDDGRRELAAGPWPRTV